MPRRIRLHRFQWVGLALLLVPPALALAGALGESWRAELASSGSLAAAIRYPSRFRYKQLNQIEVQLRNLGTGMLDTVWVSLDTALTSRFSTVRSIPPFDRPFRIPLTQLEPASTRLVLVEIQAERYGSHTGTLTVTGGGPDTLRIPLRILVFP